jgi:hypothetical protein
VRLAELADAAKESVDGFCAINWPEVGISTYGYSCIFYIEAVLLRSTVSIEY